MPKTSTVSSVRDNIYRQFEASKKIFRIIPRLAEVAEEQDNEKRKESLEEVMKELLIIAEKLSDDASTVAENLVNFIKESG